MKTLVHYALEGLVTEGSDQVWVCLGTFGSSDEAQTASKRLEGRMPGRRIDNSRIIALFRDPTGGYPEQAPVTRSIIPAPKSDAFSTPVTVA